MMAQRKYKTKTAEDNEYITVSHYCDHFEVVGREQHITTYNSASTCKIWRRGDSTCNIGGQGK